MKPQKWDAELAVTRPVPDDPLMALDFDAAEPPFTAHISAKSLSSIDAYRRALQNYYGKDLEWDRLLVRACRMAEEAHRSAPTECDPMDYPLPDGNPHLVETVLPKDELSMIFGLGEAAKSLSALGLCMAMASRNGSFAGMRAEYARTLWLDYENPTPAKLALRMNRIAMGHDDDWGLDSGAIRWMPARGVPLCELLPSVKRAMARTMAQVLVVDSAAPACGGNAIDQETATRTTNAALSLGKTVLMIAHTNKAEDDRMPFGSAFWNYAIHGKSWFLKRVSEADADEVTVGWYSRKVSDGRRPRDFAVRVTFDGDRGPVRFGPGDLLGDAELRGRVPLSQQIVGLLRVPMLTGEIAEALDADQETIRRTAGRMRDRGALVSVREGHEMRWGRKA